MSHNTFLIGAFVTIVLSNISVAQEPEADLCGDLPTAPEVVDGSTSTMEDLIANSSEVQGFIAEADEYLDCQKAVVNDTTNGLSRDERNAREETFMSLVRVRNEIGDLFNAEVGAFKAANPE